MSWNKLSMRDRAAYIKLGINNGITDLNTIREIYNKYAQGGPLKEYGYNLIKSTSSPGENYVIAYTPMAGNIPIGRPRWIKKNELEAYLKAREEGNRYRSKVSQMALGYNPAGSDTVKKEDVEKEKERLGISFHLDPEIVQADIENAKFMGTILGKRSYIRDLKEAQARQAIINSIAPKPIRIDEGRYQQNVTQRKQQELEPVKDQVELADKFLNALELGTGLYGGVTGSMHLYNHFRPFKLNSKAYKTMKLLDKGMPAVQWAGTGIDMAQLGTDMSNTIMFNNPNSTFDRIVNGTELGLDALSLLGYSNYFKRKFPRLDTFLDTIGYTTGTFDAAKNSYDFLSSDNK